MRLRKCSGIAVETLIIAFCLLLGALPGFTQEKQGRVDEARRSFSQLYQESLRRSGIIGSSYVFVHDNQVIDRQLYGLAHQEENRKVDENTIFHWASITKTFTGIAIMQLRDRGKLRLDDPIVKYVPELNKVYNRFGDMKEITIRHLMSHSAGFRAATWPWGGDQSWHPAEPPNWEQLAAMMPYTDVQFKPGSKFSYSNPGIVFLGRVIEILAGEDYEVYINKNIFRPLEMMNSYFDTSPYHLVQHRSHSYRLKDGKLTPGRFDMDTGVTVSNGGLNSPFPDMVRYLNFLLGDQRKQAAYDGVLRRTSLEEMWVEQLEVPPTQEGRDRKDYMALTFFVEKNFGMRFIGHSGHQNNFVTHFYLNPELRAGYIVAFNTYAVPSEGFMDHDTDGVDLKVKEYLFQNLFPLLRR